MRLSLKSILADRERVATHYKDVFCSKESSIAAITHERPQIPNAPVAAVGREMTEVFADTVRGDELRKTIFTGRD